MRLVLLFELAGCVRQLGPAAPFAEVHGSGPASGYPIAIGTGLDLGDQAPTRTPLHLERLRGDHDFQVRPVSPQISVEATLRHGSTTYVYRSPRLRVVVPAAFEVVCEREAGSQQWETFPCDQPMQGERGVWVEVKAPSEPPLGAISVNGKPKTDGGRFPLGDVLPPGSTTASLGRVKPGDYSVVVEVNPAPDTIRRELTLHVR